MFVVLSWLKGPISPTYRDQTQLVGVAFMQLMAALCACPISVPCSVPILPCANSTAAQPNNSPPWRLALQARRLVPE